MSKQASLKELSEMKPTKLDELCAGDIVTTKKVSRTLKNQDGSKTIKIAHTADKGFEFVAVVLGAQKIKEPFSKGVIEEQLNEVGLYTGDQILKHLGKEAWDKFEKCILEGLV